MNNKEINQQIADRYLKWSKISLKIGLIVLVITVIMIAFNTGNNTMTFFSALGLIIAFSCISEYCIL